jgi:UDP-N-acetyl-2-amino-2-deoxyglucuronate dehydrogenase
MNFSIIGPSGYIAGRHLDAIIKLSSYNIVSYLDLLPSKFRGLNSKTKFFNDEVAFFSDLCSHDVDFLIICSPNFMHFQQIKKSLELGINVISEKPICINSNELDQLVHISNASKADIFGIMQLRMHPVAMKLKNIASNIENPTSGKISFITHRDEDYKKSWKVSTQKSGGILFNLGVHYFDLLIQAFGKPINSRVLSLDDFHAFGSTEFVNLSIDWKFSIRDDDLPANQNTLREFIINNQTIDFSNVSNDLHFENYKEIINNKQFKLSDLYDSHLMVAKINEQ